MTLKVKRAFLSLLLLLIFVIGCSKGEPEVKVDPTMAGKPFPKAGGRQGP